MLTSTTEQVPNRQTTEILGVVIGNIIRSRNIGSDFLAGLRNVVSGEVTQYTRLMSDAREEALQRMQQEAEQLRADAIVGIRLTTSQITQGAAEIVAYGTAVKLR